MDDLANENRSHVRSAICDELVKSQFLSRNNSEENGQLASLMHPLLIPNILQKILYLLPTTSLESCRLVCKTWNQEACRITRKKIPVVLDLTKMGKHLPKTSLAFTKYMLKMEDTMDFPHAHFEFRRLRPHHRNLFNPSNYIMQCFLDKFGGYIKYLHVDVLYPDFQFAELLIAVRDKIPFLEALSFTFHQFDHEEFDLGEHALHFQLPHVKHFNVEVSRIREEEYLVNLIPNLLKLMPNVTWVSSACNSLNPYAENPNTMTAVLRSITGGFAKNLTKIDVKVKLNEEDILDLAKKIHFRPTDMIIAFDGEIKSPTFLGLMQKMSKTLENLTMKTPNPQVCTLETFPGLNVKMVNLQKLTLSSCYCGPLTSLQNIPKLEVLDVTNLDLEDLFPGNTCILDERRHPLKTLDISGCLNQSVPSMQIITTAFTQLKTLTFDATDSTIGVIYKNLPQLEKLNITGENLSELTDFGICGISEQQSCAGNNEGNPSENVTRNTEPSVPRPLDESNINISALKNLMSLTLECKNLTDTAVLYGIVKCSKLKNLTLGSPLISKDSLVAVSNLEMLETLNVTVCSHPSIDYKVLSSVHKKMASHNGTLIIDDGRPGYREYHS